MSLTPPSEPQPPQPPQPPQGRSCICVWVPGVCLRCLCSSRICWCVERLLASRGCLRCCSRDCRVHHTWRRLLLLWCCCRAFQCLQLLVSSCARRAHHIRRYSLVFSGRLFDLHFARVHGCCSLALCHCWMQRSLVLWQDFVWDPGGLLACHFEPGLCFSAARACSGTSDRASEDCCDLCFPVLVGGS